MGVLLDDNNRKPICRFHFNSEKAKYISLFDESKNAQKMQIEQLDDIYRYSSRLKHTIGYYDK